MNNEETIIMQPQNEKKAEETKNTVETPKTDTKEANKKSGIGRAAATVGAAAIGGVAGSAGTIAAATVLADEEEPVVDTVDDETENHGTDAATTPEPVVVEEEPEVVDEEKEHDYTNHNGQDVVTQNVQPTNNEVAGTEDDGVVILGIEEGVNQDGTPMEAVYMTDGETVAAVADVDGDGGADILWVDENQNLVVEENEILDISDEGVEMAVYEQAYAEQEMAVQEEIAQMEQQALEQQETIAYNAADETDYNNDVDVCYM